MDPSKEDGMAYLGSRIVTTRDRGGSRGRRYTISARDLVIEGLRRSIFSAIFRVGMFIRNGLIVEVIRDYGLGFKCV